MDISNEKSYKIQVLRGLAIIAVVTIHNTPPGLTSVWCRPFLNFSVGLFLFLSGMLSKAERWYPWKRIFKVLIPYTIWSLIYVIIRNIKTQSLAVIPIDFIKSILTAQASPIMYYIFVYCQFTLLIPVIDRLSKSKYKYIGFAIAPLEIILIHLLPVVMGLTINTYIRVLISISCLTWFTYYYLGYLIGNNLIRIRMSNKYIFILWCIAIALQILEGYWYYSMGVANCGTQAKITAILSGTLFAILAYRFIIGKAKIDFKQNIPIKVLHILGEMSFGIYFSHLAVMSVLGRIPYYYEIVKYPVNAVIVLIVTSICVILGRKVLGVNSKYFAL